MAIAHAKLSASGADKWMLCPGSISLEENIPDKGSDYAREGTCAHEVGDLCLKNDTDAEEYIGCYFEGFEVTKEMAEYVQEYVDYVRAHMKKDTLLLTEQRVDYSHVVPEGFGTLDSAVVHSAERRIHIFDLKYGKGVAVEAEGNRQGRTYAVGLVNAIEWLYDGFDEVVVHICQPRVSNGFTCETVRIEDVYAHAEALRVAAQKALSPDPEFNPGEKQCRWCKAKSQCSALFDFVNDQLDLSSFGDDAPSDPIPLERRVELHRNQKLINNLLNDNEAFLLEKLKKGDAVPDMKLVEGRSNRKYIEDAEAEFIKESLLNHISDNFDDGKVTEYLCAIEKSEAKTLDGWYSLFVSMLDEENLRIVKSEIMENVYNHKLIGLSDASKRFGKEFVNRITDKPKGSPTLAFSDDKRKDYVPDADLDAFDGG